MSALPIIEDLDVFEDVLLRVIPCGVVPMVHELALERPEETLEYEGYQSFICASISISLHLLAASSSEDEIPSWSRHGRLYHTIKRMIQFNVW